MGLLVVPDDDGGEVKDDIVLFVVVIVSSCLPLNKEVVVGEEPPEDAFLDNKDWKKLANTSWEGPPGWLGLVGLFTLVSIGGIVVVLDGVAVVVCAACAAAACCAAEETEEALFVGVKLELVVVNFVNPSLEPSYYTK